MAVVSNIEWKIESAWITALQSSADLSGVTIRRHNDVSSQLSYPCITVHCSGAMQPPEWAGTVGYDIAIVEISAFTHRNDDNTGETVATNIGAVRDIVRDTNLKGLLEQEPGLSMYGMYVDGFSSTSDDQRIRKRSMTVTNHVTCSDIPNDNSSSSSTSSANSSSSSESSSQSITSISSSSSDTSLSSSSQSSGSSSSQSSTSESSANSSSSSSTLNESTSSLSSQSSTSESSG